MAVGGTDVTFVLHETCRLCLLNISGIDAIPIFLSTSDADHPEIILNEFDFLKLKVGRPRKMFRNPVKSLTELSKSLQIARDDGLPQQICNDCLQNLLNIREFQRASQRSQDILEKYFKASSTATVPIKLITDLNESNFSDFEFLSIDESVVEFDNKIEVMLWAFV